ncbi:MAG TPA: histidine ammonia-lyase [Actinomycetota bacterium]|nr:histidine ammonia-lyase [Actinomycetota bacterium]
MARPLPDSVVIDGGPIGTDEVVAVARHGAKVEVGADVATPMVRAREHVERHLASGQAVYGITTGFGALADVRIEPGDIQRLQHNVIRSHAAGTGELLPAEVVRAMMLLRARSLSAGYSGVRPILVERLADLLNAGIHPAVPSRGSVGASGDLAQLAHIAQCLIGEGQVLANGGSEPAGQALRRAGLEPLDLQAKEGIAMVNGTEGMLALGLLAEHDAAALLTTGDITAAMSVEAALGTDGPYAAEIQELRPHPGQAASASNFRALLEGSPIIASHRESEHAVQDPYSMRCAPQVHGAARDAGSFAREVFDRERASVVDNPVILPDGRVESTGNFHGEPLAYALDLLGVAMTGVANISERRTYWLLGPGERRGLPPFLSTDAGLGSGYMLAQYTQASLVTECKISSAPAGVDSIPTSGTQEDHVSMGWLSGLKTRRILELVTSVLAIEAVCAAQALDLRRPMEPAIGTAAVLRAIRERVPFLDADRDVSVDIRAAEELVRSGGLVEAAQAEVGELR